MKRDDIEFVRRQAKRNRRLISLLVKETALSKYWHHIASEHPGTDNPTCSKEHRFESFEARVNYSQEDKVIASEPEFVSSDNKPVGKFQRKEITAKKLSKEEIAKRLESLQQVMKKRSEKMIGQ